MVHFVMCRICDLYNRSSVELLLEQSIAETFKEVSELAPHVSMILNYFSDLFFTYLPTYCTRWLREKSLQPKEDPSSE